MAQVKVLPQSKEALLKSYNKRLKDDIKSMVENFTEIVILARPTHEDDGGNVVRPLATGQDQCEMNVRAGNIVSSCVFFAEKFFWYFVSDFAFYISLKDFFYFYSLFHMSFY